MNDIELREHLRAVTAGLDPTPPTLAALRREAQRRGRRLRVATAGVAAVAVVGAGVGIAVAAHRGPAAVRTVTAAAGTVTAPCATGSVQVTVGRTVSLAGCPAGTTASSSDAAVLGSTGATTFLAQQAGTAQLSIVEKTACQLSPTHAACPALARLGGVVTVTVLPAGAHTVGSPPVVVSSSSTSPTPRTTLATVPSRGRDVSCSSSSALQIPVGGSLTLTGCPADADVTRSGSALSQAGLTFTGVEPGTSTIVVRTAACALLPAPIPADCAGGIGQVTITVTVTGPTASGSPVR